MYFDSIVILPFLDFFSLMQSAICMNRVKVSGGHRLNHDCNSEGVNLFSESPVNMHVELILEARDELHFFSHSITTLC